MGWVKTMHNSSIIHTRCLPDHSFKNTPSIPYIGPDFNRANVYHRYTLSELGYRSYSPMLDYKKRRIHYEGILEPKRQKS
jgi:hypothetical protein